MKSYPAWWSNRDGYAASTLALTDCENTRPALKSLAIAHLQTAHTMLYVAGTTENEATKACCLAKTRRICDRLNVWTKRYPYLRDLRDELEDLIRHLPDA